jgi:hypothetical protein
MRLLVAGGATAFLALCGWAIAHGVGAALTWRPGFVWRQHLTLPTHGAVSLAVGVCALLGPVGWALAIGLVVALRASPVPQATGWALPTAVTLLGLARPWAPTLWDEFVWLGKARLVSQGPFAVAIETANAAASVIPAGYPPGWPSVVGWLGLGIDSLELHVVAAGLMGGLCAAAAIQAWAPLVKQWHVAWWAWAAVLLTPLPWVHLRSAYVDLPVGWLALSLLGGLLHGSRPSPLAWASAILLVAFKDEGLAHVVTVTVAALWAGRRGWAVGPLLGALAWVAVWRIRLASGDASNVDHALAWPAWSEFGALSLALVKHATDFYSWGVFWALALGALIRVRGEQATALRTALMLAVASILVGLLLGTERMRAFAANGTLLNRLLVQLWPMASCAVVFGVSARKPTEGVTSR